MLAGVFKYPIKDINRKWLTVTNLPVLTKIGNVIAGQTALFQ